MTEINGLPVDALSKKIVSNLIAVRAYGGIRDKKMRAGLANRNSR